MILELRWSFFVGIELWAAKEFALADSSQPNVGEKMMGHSGLWQISGRSDLSYEDRIRLDVGYIRKHTIWMDIELIVKTVSAVLETRGAY
jgi:lipopolysaccharide/colanic/teichoic acid biosynthesis glycosyltransferase